MSTALCLISGLTVGLLLSLVNSLEGDSLRCSRGEYVSGRCEFGEYLVKGGVTLAVPLSLWSLGEVSLALEELFFREIDAEDFVRFSTFGTLVTAVSPSVAEREEVLRLGSCSTSDVEEEC